MGKFSLGDENEKFLSRNEVQALKTLFAHFFLIRKSQISAAARRIKDLKNVLETVKKQK